MVSEKKTGPSKGKEKEKEEEKPVEKILGDEHWRRWEEKNKLPFVSFVSFLDGAFSFV